MHPLVGRPSNQQPPLARPDTQLARILGAIEEYVYIGEFLPKAAATSVVFAGPCREKFLGMGAEQRPPPSGPTTSTPTTSPPSTPPTRRPGRTEHLDVEYRLIGADGVVRWVRDRGRLRLEDGRDFLDGSILDVTPMHAARRSSKRPARSRTASPTRTTSRGSPTAARSRTCSEAARPCRSGC